jgi:phenylpropionate dioxygenase-like ring-hydroxylating dioxygenase large terminal subunit
MNAMLRFWHPVLSSRELLKEAVVGIKVAGDSIALFRTRDGKVGAIGDLCAHRRMKLSLGSVQGCHLVCPYHGWSFNAEGFGESPSAPKMHACVSSYDSQEAAGAIWIKERGSPQELIAPSMPGWNVVRPVFSRVRAPLELVIDNFSEVEHTVTTHPHFGFTREGASEAVCRMESDEASVSIRSHGPAKMPPLDTRLAVGVRRGDRFHSEFTFTFTPPRSSVRHFWTEPLSGRERMLTYQVYHYFVPEDEGTTVIVTFGFLQIRWGIFKRCGAPAAWAFRRKLRKTVEEDAFLLENLADQSPEIEGMRLSRFDSILGLTRDRLRRIYYVAQGDCAPPRSGD